MGYTIFYDRRFIRVGDKIIPIVQAGSNNCWQNNWNGTQIPEKSWNVLSYPIRNQILFAEEELTKLYQHESYKEFHHKSRNRGFDDFSKWLINGIKSAKTVEETMALRNKVILDFTDKEGNYHFFDINTEEELLSLINEHCDNEVNVRYSERDYQKEKRIVEKKEKDYSKGYYVIDVGNRNFLMKLKKYGFYYTTWRSGAKKFLTEAEGNRYFAKYRHRFDKEAILTFLPPSPQ